MWEFQNWIEQAMNPLYMCLFVVFISHHILYSIIYYGSERGIASLDPFAKLAEGVGAAARVYLGDPDSIWGHFYSNMRYDVGSMVLKSMKISSAIGYYGAGLILILFLLNKALNVKPKCVKVERVKELRGMLEQMKGKMAGRKHKWLFLSVERKAKALDCAILEKGDAQKGNSAKGRNVEDDTKTELRSPLHWGRSEFSTTETEQSSFCESESERGTKVGVAEGQGEEAKKLAEGGNLARVVSFLISMILLANATNFVFGGLPLKSIGFPDLFLARILYSKAIEAHAAFFLSGVFDTVAFFVFLWILYRLKSALGPIAAGACLLFFMLVAQPLLMRPKCDSKDRHWLMSNREVTMHELMDRQSSLPAWVLSDYVKGYENIDIAVDTYLPKYMFDKNGQIDLRKPKLPVHIVFTRYDRRMTVTWPFSMISIFGQKRGGYANIWSWEYVDALIPHEIAVMVVDVRGTGSSGGSRTIDLSDEELKDFPFVVEYAKRQTWSNGQVSVGGISYDGMTGLQVASNTKVDAVVALFSPINVFDELFVPGGLMCRSFLRDYMSLTKVFEESSKLWSYFTENIGRFPIHIVIGFTFGFTGAAGVPHRLDRHPSNVAQHFRNWKMSDVVDQIEFLDDAVFSPEGSKINWDRIMHQEKTFENLGKSKTPVYLVGGFCDAGIVRGLSRIHRVLKEHGSTSQLTLGPWTHGGRRSCSPYSGSYSCFEQDMYIDLAHFLKKSLNYWPERGGSASAADADATSGTKLILDRYNKRWPEYSGELERFVALETAPVRYWVIGEEQWRRAEEWPPRERTETSFEFSAVKYNVESEGADGFYKKRQSRSWGFFQQFASATSHGYFISTIAAKACHKLLKLVNDMPYLLKSGGMLSFLFPSSARGVDQIMNGQKHTYVLLPNQPQLFHSMERPRAPLCYPPLGPSSAALNKLASRVMSCYVLGHADYWALRAAGSADFAQYIEALEQDRVVYEVDYHATTGEATRWPVAQHPFRLPVGYGNRLFSKRNSSAIYGENSRRREPKNLIMTKTAGTIMSGVAKLARLVHRFTSNFPGANAAAEKTDFSAPLAFVSPPLQQPLTLVGAPLVQLLLGVKDCTDVVVFAYLEEVDRDSNTVHYITEGKVMASHRASRVDRCAKIGTPDVVLRNYTSADYSPVSQEEEILVPLTLEPTAWTVQPGRSLRLTLVGSDVDNFMLRYHRHDMKLPEEWEFFVRERGLPDRNAASSLSLRLSKI